MCTFVKYYNQGYKCILALVFRLFTTRYLLLGIIIYYFFFFMIILLSI